MFVPSVQLLSKWHLTRGTLKERTWATVLNDHHGQLKSAISPYSEKDKDHIIPGANCDGENKRYGTKFTRDAYESTRGDPNNEYDEEAIRNWVSLSDFYTWPHIHVFDSWSHLFSLLDGGVDLIGTSSNMALAMAKIENATIDTWRSILITIKELRKERNKEGNLHGHTVYTADCH